MPRFLSYGLQRLTAGAVLVLILIAANFLLIQAAPGDPATMLIGEASAPALLEQIRREFGLDRPLHEQFIAYVTNVARGNLGISYRYRIPVSELIVQRLPATLLLMISAFALSMILGTLLGMIAAYYQGSVFDSLASILALIGYSLPVFWVGMLLLMLFGVQLGWLPLSGTHTIGMMGSSFDVFIDRLRHLILPSVTICVAQLALIFRLTRGRMIEELTKDYVTQARAKGTSEFAIVVKHALRNVGMTLVTIAGLRIGVLFAGALLTEVVFSWPGIGQLMYGAMLGRDYPVVMGVFTIVVCVTILSNILTDVAYGFLDPRVHYG